MSALTVFLLAARVLAQPPQQAAAEARVPVLVELFTSEGCSDCPPADRILEELDTKQPVLGVQAIVLSEHVTYWNHLGWRDPFSLDEVDQRQKDYGDRFHLDSVYTPQAVIDGSAQLVGNNAGGMAKAIEHAAETAKKPLAIADARWEQNAVTFTVHGNADLSLRLFAVIAANANGHQVQRGENAGRTLHHVAVARSFKEFPAGALENRTLRLGAGGNFSGEQENTPLRLVVFLADKKTGQVVAAAEQVLSH